MIEKDSKCLIIVGMHRSGTSYTASVLKQSGLNIGERLMGAGIGNDLGHFENEDFYHFHQKALNKRAYHNDGWSLNTVEKFDSDELEEARNIISINNLKQWGWKDPRTALFLDAWKKLIPDAHFLFIYRKPWEVVESLFRRNTDNELLADPILTIESWQFYNEQILTFFNKNKERSLLVEVENIMQRSSDLIELLNDRFGFKLNQNIANLFDKNRFQHHSNENQQFFTESVFPSSILLYKQLQEQSSIKPLNIYKASKGKMEALMKWWYESSQISRFNKEISDRDKIINRHNILINDISNKVNNLEKNKIELNTQIDSLEEKTAELTTYNTNLKNELSWIVSSKWWRLRRWLKK